MELVCLGLPALSHWHCIHPTVHPQTCEDWAGSLARAEDNTGPKSYKSLFHSVRKSNLYFPRKMDGGHNLRAC